MTTIYLDIETIPTMDESVIADIAAGITPPGNMTKAETIVVWEREKKPALIEAAVARTSFDGALGRICVIGWAIDNDPVAVLHTGDGWSSAAAEAAMLRAFFADIDSLSVEEGIRSEWVGHNVADFDLRFIFQRAVIHGIRPSMYIPFRAKPWGDRIFDTMVAWSGIKDRVSLDKLCRSLGVAGKGSELGGEDIDGSRVWEYVKAGRIADVATYCKGDVERVREIHSRMTFARAA